VEQFASGTVLLDPMGGLLLPDFTLNGNVFVAPDEQFLAIDPHHG
jgi:hypothetical protein